MADEAGHIPVPVAGPADEIEPPVFSSACMETVSGFAILIAFFTYFTILSVTIFLFVPPYLLPPPISAFQETLPKLTHHYLPHTWKSIEFLVTLITQLDLKSSDFTSFTFAALPTMLWMLDSQACCYGWFTYYGEGQSKPQEPMLDDLVEGLLQMSIANKIFGIFKTLITAYNARSTQDKFHIALDYMLSGAVLLTVKATVFVSIHWITTYIVKWRIGNGTTWTLLAEDIVQHELNADWEARDWNGHDGVLD